MSKHRKNMYTLTNAYKYEFIYFLRVNYFALLQATNELYNKFKYEITKQ